MSILYNGLGAVPSRATPVAIASSTNANPILVTCGSAHGLLDGDRVQIIGHAVNTAANGIGTITKVSATQFLINGSFGSGVGGATGTVQSLNLLPTEPILVDGVDPLDSAHIHGAVEGALDKASYLAERTGLFRMVDWYTSGTVAAPASTSATGASSSNAWGTPSNVNDAVNLSYVKYFDAIANDIMELQLTGTVSVAGGGTPKVAFRWGYEAKDYGVAFTGTPGATGFANQTCNTYENLCLRESIQLSIPRGQKVLPRIQDYGVGAANTYLFVGDIRVTWVLWRAN